MAPMTQTGSVEKSPIDEKASYELNEVAASPTHDSASQGSNETPPKRKLPYAWQLVMIFMTCMCTCEYIALSVASLRR